MKRVALVLLTGTLAAAPAGSSPVPPHGRIVFAISEAGGTAIGIYVINPDGSGRRRLASGYDEDPVWSADGRKIAFSDIDTSGVIVMNADGSNKKRVADGESPAWLPDGTRLI